MKNTLFKLMLCFIMLFSVLPVFAGNGVDTYLSERKEISLKGNYPESSQRSPFPIQAFIAEQHLTVYSLKLDSSFTVTITNLSTGKVIYEDTFNVGMHTTTVDLTTEDCGEYEIRLWSANWLLYGDFSL